MKNIITILVALILLANIGDAIEQPEQSFSIIQTQDIEPNDFVWGTIDVDTIGLVSISAWTDPGSTIFLNIYNETGKLILSRVGSPTASIDYIAPTTGIYRFKIYTGSFDTEIRKFSASSNKQISFMPRYIKRSLDVPQNELKFFDINVNRGDLIFLDEWTNNGGDTVLLSVFNETGRLVATYSGFGRILLDHIAQTTGTYTIKGVITSAYQGGTRTLSLSSSITFGDIPVDSDQIVFVRGEDNGLWYRTFDGTSWGPWTGLGGIISDDPDASTLNNKVYVFARGTDNALWYRVYDGSWSAWTSLGGIINSAPGVSTWGNKLYVFARGTDNALWQRNFDGTSWTGWTNLGGIINSGPGAS